MKTEERDIYAALTPAEVAALPTVFRDDLFQGQVVLVSGGAGGIGFATSVLFGRLGASIVSCGRDEEKMSWLAEQLDALEIPCLTRAMTIRDPDQVADLMTEFPGCYSEADPPIRSRIDAALLIATNKVNSCHAR